MWKKYLYTITLSVMLGIAFSASAECSSDGYPNPITACDLRSFILSVASSVVKIAIPLAVLAIIFIGFKFIAASARGDTKGLQDAKKMFQWTLVGTAVVVGAVAIAYAVFNTGKAL